MDSLEIIEKLRPFPELLPVHWPAPAKPFFPPEKPPPAVVKEYEADDFIEQAFAQMFEDGRPSWAHANFDSPAKFLEDNIADHSTIISRIREYRDAIIDIEASRIRAGLAYALVVATANADFDLEIAKSENPNAIRTAASAKKEAIIQGVRDLQARHALSGGALNFNERRRRLEEQIKLDLRSAYDRVLAVIAGLLRLEVPPRLQRSLPFPTVEHRQYANFEGASFFDDWIRWNRLMLDYVEDIQNNQSIQQVSVSLGLKSHFVNVIHVGSAPEGARPHLGALHLREVDEVSILVPDLIQILKQRKKAEFIIKRHTVGWPFIGEIGSSLALRSIGLSASLNEDQRTKWRFGAVLLTPDGVRVSLPSIPLLADGPNWVSDPVFYNQDPRGKWKLELALDPLHDGGAGGEVHLDPNQWPLLDIQLHLRVAAMVPPIGTFDPEPDLGSWRFT